MTCLPKLFRIFLIASLVGVPLLMRWYPVQAVHDSVYLRLDRMNEATATDFMVVINVSNATNWENLFIDFPAGWTVGASCTTAVTNIPSGTTALPGTLTCAASNSDGGTIEVAGISGADASTTYAVRVTGGLTNPTVASSSEYQIPIATRTLADAQIDTSDVAVYVLNDTGNDPDQVIVTATVDETFTFTLGGTSVALGTLSASSPTTAVTGVTATIVTNASNGWVAFMKGSDGDSNGTADLYSSSKTSALSTYGSLNGTVEDLGSLDGNTEGYVVDVILTTDATDPQGLSRDGTVTVQGEYDGAADPNDDQGGYISTNLTVIASSNGPTGGDILTLEPRAKSSAYTPAATDYTSTLTVVGAGNF